MLYFLIEKADCWPCLPPGSQLVVTALLKMQLIRTIQRKNRVGMQLQTNGLPSRGSGGGRPHSCGDPNHSNWLNWFMWIKSVWNAELPLQREDAWTKILVISDDETRSRTFRGHEERGSSTSINTITFYFLSLLISFLCLTTIGCVCEVDLQ